MKCWKRFNLWFYCGFLCLVWAVFPAIPGSAKTVDRIVAKVNEKIITQSELEERVAVKMMSLRKMNAQPMPSKEAVIYEELERMIEERLLIDAGKKFGLKVDEENVTKAIDEIKRTNGLNDGDLEKMLQAESKSMEEYKNKISDQILISRVIGYEVRKRVTVSDEEVEEYYNQHLKEYWVPEKLQLRHILFIMDDTLLEEDKRIKKEKAHLALRKIRSGEDFIAVAKEFSEDISANTGGDLGEIERGKMVPEFEKAAFLLEEGEVSGLVETPYGLHIIKVDKIFPGQTLPLDKVQAQIENRFKDQKLKAEYQRYLSELKEKAFIENKMSPPPQSVGNNIKKTAPVKTVKPSLNRGDVLADIPASQKKKDSSRQLTQEQEFTRFQTFEEKLRYYKQLRNNNKISEGEYQNKKRELLSQF
jgi:peptidyl-prolyl cis-trans isomerase SurA